MDSSSCLVNAYWMCVADDRDIYASALLDELAEEPVVVLVIRDGGFTNPNAVAADFVALVSLNREVCERRLDRHWKKCGFILISRSELAAAQISSPIELPEWFPVGGGTTVSAVIQDLSWTTDAPLSAAELRVGDLCQSVLDLEDALLRRLTEVAASDADRRKTMAFIDLIRRDESQGFDDVLQSAIAYHAGVTTPEAFRPSLRDSHSMVARLWGVVQEKTPEQMSQPSKALASALDLPDPFDASWHESIASVLRRPSSGEPVDRIRFARNLLLTIATVCQLITAAAHADGYERYPVPLLRSLSYDLRRALLDAATAIEMLSHG